MDDRREDAAVEQPVDALIAAAQRRTQFDDHGDSASEREISSMSDSKPPSPPAPGRAGREQPPVRWREVLAVLLLVVLCDVTIYRGQGFAGYALLFVLAPVLLLLGSPRPRHRLSLWTVGLMLAVLAAKMLWCGSLYLVAAGFALLVAFAMALSGLCPYVLEVAVFLSQTILAGYEGLTHHWRSVDKHRVLIGRGTCLNVTLPLASFLAFSVLFILANPALVTFFGEGVEAFFNTLRDWITRFSPSFTEVLFWVAVLWVVVGLLRPVITQTLFQETSGKQTPAGHPGPPSQTLLYPAFRNMLVTVIVLFAVYLVFELTTLWFREFPEGFCYSGYAHEGAAWLTVALALATLILSLVFRGQILQDPRLPGLQRLAWIWSLENALLAVAVYYRLYIYVGFNGMSWMRTVGIFGMSAVVIGFILVVWKIAHNRDFIWLVRRHLWTLALTIYLFALTPVDTIVTTYNVRRILSGDPAPSVQISVHPIGSEGVLLLRPLLNCQDETIREGVRAMLAQRHEDAEKRALRRQEEGWTAFQISDRVVLRELRAAQSDWSEYADPDRRNTVRKKFNDYAYQWY